MAADQTNTAAAALCAERSADWRPAVTFCQFTSSMANPTHSDQAEAGFKRFLPRSLQPQQLKRNPSLIPLLFFTALGGGWAAYYLARLALRGPEVMWNPNKNPEPWNEYTNKQYKFYSTIDHSKLENPRPKF